MVHSFPCFHNRNLPLASVLCIVSNCLLDTSTLISHRSLRFKMFKTEFIFFLKPAPSQVLPLLERRAPPFCQHQVRDLAVILDSIFSLPTTAKPSCQLDLLTISQKHPLPPCKLPKLRPHHPSPGLLLLVGGSLSISRSRISPRFGASSTVAARVKCKFHHNDLSPPQAKVQTPLIQPLKQNMATHF